MGEGGLKGGWEDSVAAERVKGGWVEAGTWPDCKEDEGPRGSGD